MQCSYASCASSLKSKKRFTCSHRGYASTTLRALTNHKALHEGKRTFKCNQCDYTGARKDSIKSHSRTHSRIKLFSCDQCDFSTIYKESLSYHERSSNTQKTKVSKMAQKKTKVSVPKIKLKCEQCNYTNVKPSRMKMHFVTHNGQKDCKCDLCDHVCALVSNMKRHMLTHSKKILGFHCKQCDYSCL